MKTLSKIIFNVIIFIEIVGAFRNQNSGCNRLSTKIVLLVYLAPS